MVCNTQLKVVSSYNRHKIAQLSNTNCKRTSSTELHQLPVTQCYIWPAAVCTFLATVTLYLLAVGVWEINWNNRLYMVISLLCFLSDKITFQGTSLLPNLKKSLVEFKTFMLLQFKTPFSPSPNWLLKYEEKNTNQRRAKRSSITTSRTQQLRTNS